MAEEAMIVAQKKGECVTVVPVLCQILCQCFVSVLSFLFLVSYLRGEWWHTKKGRVPIRAGARIKRGYIGAVSGEHVLGVIKGSVSYTWVLFRAGKAQKGADAPRGRMGDFDGQQGIKGTPTTILRNRAPKAMVGPFSVKGVLCS